MSNERVELLIACKSGLEAVVKRELLDLGHESEGVSPGRVRTGGEVGSIARLNIELRAADRILLTVGTLAAPDFEALFEGVKSLAWERWLPRDAKLHVRGRCVRSKLASEPAVQRSTHKAIVERLLAAHRVSVLPETGATYTIDVSILDNTAWLTLDTTGTSLHKRGYRDLVGEAPLQETIAASMVMLSNWSPDRPLVDPFCGSGTILIEAAMIARGIAPGCIPGCERLFAAEDWPTLDRGVWGAERDRARGTIQPDEPLTIMGYDIDGKALDLARHHALRAGVSKQIHFQQRPFAELRSGKPWGVIITNPPYGERLGGRFQVDALYASFAEVFNRLPTWSELVLTAYPRLEAVVGREADRRRKLYNGDIECTLYQFFGPRPGDHTPAPSFAPRASATPSPLAAPDERLGRTAVSTRDDLAAMTARQVDTFENRLATRARHFRRWPDKLETDAYRLYTHDIPDVPVVVDRLGERAVVTELMGPRNRRTFEQHQQWLDAVAQAVARVLEIPRDAVLIRHKSPRPGARLPGEITARELGAVMPMDPSEAPNLGFERRGVRGLVREFAPGRRVLVLGDAASGVHALRAGAAQVTIVEPDHRRGQRGVRMLALNGLASDPRARMMTSDAAAALSSLARGESFELVVVSADVASGAGAGRAAIGRTAPGATVLVFADAGSFDPGSLLPRGLGARDISNRTVAEDVQDGSALRCWRITTPGSPEGGSGA